MTKCAACEANEAAAKVCDSEANGSYGMQQWSPAAQREGYGREIKAARGCAEKIRALRSGCRCDAAPGVRVPERAIEIARTVTQEWARYSFKPEPETDSETLLTLSELLLTAAPASPDAGKPVAWRYRYHKNGVWKYGDSKEECNSSPGYQIEPLYAAARADTPRGAEGD